MLRVSRQLGSPLSYWSQVSIYRLCQQQLAFNTADFGFFTLLGDTADTGGFKIAHQLIDIAFFRVPRVGAEAAGGVGVGCFYLLYCLFVSQGYLNIDMPYPADSNIVASCTISAESVGKRVVS